MNRGERSELTASSYQAALRDGWLPVAACLSCASRQVIPGETCFACGAKDLRLMKHSGSGRVFSWVVCHYAFSEELSTEVPYVVLLVELDGGARVYGRLQPPEGHPARIYADMTVELDSELTKSRIYPVFRPSSQGARATS